MGEARLYYKWCSGSVRRWREGRWRVLHLDLRLWVTGPVIVNGGVCVAIWVVCWGMLYMGMEEWGVDGYVAWRSGQ